MTTGSRIFLAHAREDKAQVRKLYADLKARGFDPWLDEKDLRAGQNWKTEIPKAIRQARLFLACLSSRSVDKVGFVQSEFRHALATFGERPPGSIYLIPVRLDECDVPDLQIPDRGLSLQDIQWVDLWQTGGLDQLVADLEYALGVANSPPEVAGEVPPTTIRSPEPVAPRSESAPDWVASSKNEHLVQSDKTREAALDQQVIDDPPKAAVVEPVPGRQRGARALSLRHPTIVAAMVGAIGVVVAALVPWLLEPTPEGSGKSDQEAEQPPPAKRAEATSPEQTAEPAPVATTAAVPEPGDEFQDCDDCPLMVVVPAGSFTMGSTEAERKWAVEQGAKQEWADREKPQHPVQIEQPFAVGKYEVTRGQFAAFVEAADHAVSSGCREYVGNEWKENASNSWRSPGFAQTDRAPVVCVSWEDAGAYIEWLSERTGQRYRLLSEAEWEYAARARTTTMRPWGDDRDNKAGCAYANGADLTAAEKFSWTGTMNGQVYTAPVGSYGANDFMLHDMIGNAWEWVEDCWHESYEGAPNEGRAWTSGDCSRRVVRGGAWNGDPGYLRAACRGRDGPDVRDYDLGFRLARTLSRSESVTP